MLKVRLAVGQSFDPFEVEGPLPVKRFGLFQSGGGLGGSGSTALSTCQIREGLKVYRLQENQRRLCDLEIEKFRGEH